MSFIDRAEQLGQAVEEGRMTKGDAIREVVEMSKSKDFTFTAAGAESLIDGWRDVRSQIVAVGDAAEKDLEEWRK